MKRVLLLSAYDAASHCYWRTTLAHHFTTCEWTTLALEPRNFSWRMRGNALCWLLSSKDVLAKSYDLILATSMTDLCSLVGFFPHLARIPTILYFHENQFAYPQSGQQTDHVHLQLQTLYAAQVATRLVFNSVYNRDTFFEGLKNLLRKLPESFPDELLVKLREKTEIIPVPVCFSKGFKPESTYSMDPVSLIWNHRWEYDKQPEVFFDAVARLRAAGHPVSVHVLGQQFRQVPACFSRFESRYEDCIVSWGFQTREHYQQILRQADMVVSTALHDFQGLAVQEAMAAGCIPVVPDRLVYPEYVPDDHRYAVGTEHYTETESRALATTIARLMRRYCGTPRRRWLDDAWSSEQVLDRYRALMASIGSDRST